MTIPPRPSKVNLHVFLESLMSVEKWTSESGNKEVKEKSESEKVKKWKRDLCMSPGKPRGSLASCRSVLSKLEDQQNQVSLCR